MTQKAAKTAKDLGVSVSAITRQPLREFVLSKALSEAIEKSNQGMNTGLQAHPFNMRMVQALMETNEHHATCINTKVASTVGLGHKYDEKEGEDKVEKEDPAAQEQPGTEDVRPSSDRLLSKADTTLDPLCQQSWADTLVSMGQDFIEVGNGWIEAVREKKGTGKVVALYHVPAASVQIFLEEKDMEYHYVVTSGESSTTRRFARFGDDGFYERKPSLNLAGTDSEPTGDTRSQLIHFRRPTSHHRWYGWPDWLSAVPCIELSQCLQQFKYDFFLNRGVPEFMLFVTGAKVEKADWEKIENALKANIGLGNSHKSIAANIPLGDVKIQLEKLAMEGSGEDDFAPMKEALALSIVTSHRVPPLLAGIQIPGKLGSNNELPNALMAFQALVLGQNQRIIQQTLGRTLGSPEAGLGLTLTDFDFYTILDEIDLSLASTVGGMKQPLASAKAEGRDLSAGMKH